LEIENITASQKDYNNCPLNAIDGKEDTFWSGNKKGSWIQADLGRIKSIRNLEILWHNGDQKLIHFEVSFSKDGKNFEDPIRFVSTGTIPEEIFSVDEPNPKQGRYVRLTFDHNTRDNYFSIVSLKVIGRNTKRSNLSS